MITLYHNTAKQIFLKETKQVASYSTLIAQKYKPEEKEIRKKTALNNKKEQSKNEM